MYYNVLAKSHPRASECIECGQCQEHCPQGIDIIDSLKLVAKTFET
ncbi:MAG: 4Fe-4S dicluster domain-containing protein [Muribaculaceae bacterium]|nr:4Fe-4S dicluster domain-containing protein [Muribaculaceae bacterium]